MLSEEQMYEILNDRTLVEQGGMFHGFYEDLSYIILIAVAVGLLIIVGMIGWKVLFGKTR